MMRSPADPAGAAARPPGEPPRIEPPLVSVILTTRDRPALLAVALECYRRQTYPRRELVVLDAGERAPADRAAVRAAGGRLVRVMPDTPAGTALNLGVDATSGPLCQRLDARDWCAPSFLAATVAAALATPDEVCRPPLAFPAPFLQFDLARWALSREGAGRGAGRAILFAREAWAAAPFRPIDEGVGACFVRDLGELGVAGRAVRAVEAYVAIDPSDDATDGVEAVRAAPEPGADCPDADRQDVDRPDPAGDGAAGDGAADGPVPYGLGLPEAVVPEWALRTYRALHRSRLAAGAVG